MNYKLKAHIFRYSILMIASFLPFTIGLTISIIGMCLWNWEGRAAIVIFSTLVISIVSGVITFAFIDEEQELIEEYFKEEKKSDPKPNAWKEGI